MDASGSERLDARSTRHLVYPLTCLPPPPHLSSLPSTATFFHDNLLKNSMQVDISRLKSGEVNLGVRALRFRL